MTKLVVLKFNGSLESGFQVTLEIGQEGKSAERGCVGSLPTAAELNHCLSTWQRQYNQQGNNHRIKPQQIIYDGSINPRKQLLKAANQLQQVLDEWLNSPDFYSIDKQLREELNREEVIRILICSDRPEIYQLPWCCWDLVESYPKLEIAYSNPNFARTLNIAKAHSHHKVRILAIIGNAQGINLDSDLAAINAIEEGEVEFLLEPTPQQLFEYLWQKTWDIVFFAGHSKTLDRQGILYLNGSDHLTIEQLRHGFKRAIASGLQLAIFNSCDGLGLAEELGQLSLPQSIVMRMPIPDVMAQQFVKYFLQAYAKDDSLYLAVRKAREQLQGWEKKFPCASWLPIIYQNPAIIPPQWSDLHTNSSFKLYFAKLRTKQQLSFPSILLITAIATILVWLIQSWGWLQAGELNAYDRLMSWRFFPPTDERVLVITIDDNDRSYQREQGMGMNMRGSLADAALYQLVTKLQSGEAKAIASDIIHDFPFEAQLADKIAQTDNFVAICRVKINQPKLIISIPPPSLLAKEQVGFSNWAIDPDETVRRQILGMSPDDVCQSDVSLSLRLALKYLDHVSAGFNDQGVLEIENTAFPKLQATSGGYHLPEAQGYQILLNYRRALPATISLQKILTMPQQAINKLVKDKVILIGVVGYNHDLHHTPFSRGQEAKRLPGVIIHALMTNQIIEAVLGERKLLRWVSDQGELLWIVFWSMIGTLIVIFGKGSLIKITWRIAGSLTLLFACCWLLLLQGIWLVAIAPALGLMLSAVMIAVYSRD